MSFLWGFLTGLALALVMGALGSWSDRRRAEAGRIRDRMPSGRPPGMPSTGTSPGSGQAKAPVRVDGTAATWLGRKSSARPRNLPGGPVQTGPGTWTWR